MGKGGQGALLTGAGLGMVLVVLGAGGIFKAGRGGMAFV